MDNELETALQNSYPEVFKHLNTPIKNQNAEPITTHGIQCDNGWFTILDSLAHAIETFLNPSLNKPVQAVQVKEKFGKLRFYTNHTPESLGPVVKFAQSLSGQTCEQCGDTRNTITRSDLPGRTKTLCDEHYYDARDVPTEATIWGFEHTCFNCDADVPVVYPDPLGSDNGGSWSGVGPELTEKTYCNVKRVFSGQQRGYVWGNHCDQCDAYLGNYYVRKDALSRNSNTKTRIDSLPIIRSR